MLQKAWWAVLTLWLVVSTGEPSRADTLTIAFPELEHYARSASSRAAILSRQLELAEAERDDALQWSNPEIAFDREDVGPAENQFSVGKTFELPWSYWQKRASWRTRVEAAEKRYVSRTRLLLAELKSRYVTLKLLDDQLGHLNRLEDIIPEVSQIVRSRQSEGHLSSVDEQLVRMALITLHAARQSALQSRSEIDAEWRSLLGVGPETSVTLATDIPLKSVTLDDSPSYHIAVEANPGYQSRRLESDFYRAQAGAARGRFIPGLSLYGGYKEIDSAETGYVFGLSVSIPLFNRNDAIARRHAIRGEIADREAEAFRVHEEARVAGLIDRIAATQEALTAIGDPPDDQNLITALLESYEEGWLGLHEFLNAIQVMVSGVTDYHTQLSEHYKNIFELESITGETLIEFTPGETEQ